MRRAADAGIGLLALGVEQLLVVNTRWVANSVVSIVAVYAPLLQPLRAVCALHPALVQSLAPSRSLHVVVLVSSSGSWAFGAHGRVRGSRRVCCIFHVI